MSLSERLRRALETGHAAETASLAGDFHELAEQPRDGLHAAAVLIAVTDRPEPGIILTQRTETLSRHAGQVAFPGGRIDAEDADEIAAALREAEEEIALPRGRVVVVGATDRYRTGTGFEITPVLGVIPPDLVLVPAAAEVAIVFEVPLAFALDTANHVAVSAQWQGRTRHYYELMWQGHRIWGATAGMIVNLSRRLQWTT